MKNGFLDLRVLHLSFKSKTVTSPSNPLCSLHICQSTAFTFLFFYASREGSVRFADIVAPKLTQHIITTFSHIKALIVSRDPEVVCMSYLDSTVCNLSKVSRMYGKVLCMIFFMTKLPISCDKYSCWEQTATART